MAEADPQTAGPSGGVAHRRPLPWAYRRLWIPELAVLAGLAALAVAAFTGTGLDLRITDLFHHHGGRAFPVSGDLRFPWRQMYTGVGLPIIAISVAAVFVLLKGLRSVRWCAYRRYAILVLLAIALGPGLVVNLGFKNFWGRPRPSHIQEFGGAWAYQEAVEPGIAGRGKSFPCGHSSAGYVLTIFWLIFRRRRPRWAVAALAGALVYGTAVGAGRVMTGSHFASDVVWSGLLVHFTNVLLYFFILNMPGHEDSPSVFDTVPRLAPATAAGWGALAVAVIVAAFMATPYYGDIQQDRPTAAGAPVPVELALPTAEVTLAVGTGNAIRVRGHVEGFGMFGSRLRRGFTETKTPPGLQFWMHPAGWFTDLSVKLNVDVPTTGVASVRLVMREGAIAVAAPPGVALPLELDAPGAAIVLPAAWTSGAPVRVEGPPESLSYRGGASPRVP